MTAAAAAGFNAAYKASPARTSSQASQGLVRPIRPTPSRGASPTAIRAVGAGGLATVFALGLGAAPGGGPVPTTSGAGAFAPAASGAVAAGPAVSGGNDQNSALSGGQARGTKRTHSFCSDDIDEAGLYKTVSVGRCEGWQLLGWSGQLSWAGGGHEWLCRMTAICVQEGISGKSGHRLFRACALCFRLPSSPANPVLSYVTPALCPTRQSQQVQVSSGGSDHCVLHVTPRLPLPLATYLLFPPTPLSSPSISGSHNK